MRLVLEGLLAISVSLLVQWVVEDRPDPSDVQWEPVARQTCLCDEGGVTRPVVRRHFTELVVTATPPEGGEVVGPAEPEVPELEMDAPSVVDAPPVVDAHSEVDAHSVVDEPSQVDIWAAIARLRHDLVTGPDRGSGIESVPEERDEIRTKAGGTSGEHPGIRRIDDQTYEIDRDLLDSFANDLQALRSLGSAGRLRGEDGRVQGYRLRLKRDSLLLHCGLRSGDVINAVNDKEVRNVIQAFGAYRKLRRVEVVELHITRRGEELTLRYHLG